MSNSRRLRLPVTDVSAPVAATAEALRAKMGGPAPETIHPDVGSVVEIEGRPSAPAVIVFVEPSAAHVWVGEGLVRKVRPEHVRPFAAPTPASLAKVASDVRAFSSLAPGDRVSFLTAAGTVESGGLAEKCRYGALVVRDDGAVVAVGFRRIWPATTTMN
jgi:hypothetical protein